MDRSQSIAFANGYRDTSLNLWWPTMAIDGHSAQSIVLDNVYQLTVSPIYCTFNTRCWMKREVLDRCYNWNIMLQSFVSTLFKKEIGLRYSLTAAMGKTLFSSFFFFCKYYLFTQLHAAELVLSRWKLSARWWKIAHATIDLRSGHIINPRPTRFVSGKANECRWRPRRY